MGVCWPVPAPVSFRVGSPWRVMDDNDGGRQQSRSVCSQPAAEPFEPTCALCLLSAAMRLPLEQRLSWGQSYRVPPPYRARLAPPSLWRADAWIPAGSACRRRRETGSGTYPVILAFVREWIAR